MNEFGFVLFCFSNCPKAAIFKNPEIKLSALSKIILFKDQMYFIIIKVRWLSGKGAFCTSLSSILGISVKAEGSFQAPDHGQPWPSVDFFLELHWLHCPWLGHSRPHHLPTAGLQALVVLPVGSCEWSWIFALKSKGGFSGLSYRTMAVL